MKRPARRDPATSEKAQFGDYELLNEVARGGMGVVYKARQASLNRTVALKMILSGRLATDDDIGHFYSEAKAAAALNHPGTVQLYEVGEVSGQNFFSMEFVDGQTFAQRLIDRFNRLRTGVLPIVDLPELTAPCSSLATAFESWPDRQTGRQLGLALPDSVWPWPEVVQ